jgi:hypothetical protein
LRQELLRPASNATINVTYHDDTTGDLNVQAVGATIRRGNMFSLTALIPSGSQGKGIKKVNTVTLSASTTVAGNFGITATRQRSVVATNVANKGETVDWAALGLPLISNDSCLFFITLNASTSSGTLRGAGKIVHG